jgi:tetratricopeptide (TPR) repeat protein
MALFESGSRKILKKIRKFADEGSVNRVSSTVKEEKSILLEESGVSLELIELLLDIGHPNLAASVGEEVMRRHRQIAKEVRSVFIGRMHEFSRSTDLLKVTWKSFINMHDYKGAINVLRQAEEVTVTSLFDLIRDKMESSMRFDGSVHPEADQSSLVDWGLCLYRERKTGEAIDFLWKVSREVEFPHRDLSLLAFWIANQVKNIDSIYLISLMGIAAVSGQMDRALEYASKLSDSHPSQDEAVDAANVIEKWMVPSDRSGKSSAILAEMYTAAGKTEAASKTLEGIYSKSLDREELETAIEDLVAHPESGAAPLLLSAQLNLEKGRLAEATEAVERAFEAGDAESKKLIEVCREILSRTGDTTGSTAVKLALYLIENGEIKDAVFSLIPMVDSDSGWVFEQVQRLIVRDRNNASVLALLAAVLFETGKREKASATLEHLSKRTDKNFCIEAAEVLDSMENQIRKYPELREARALFRFRSERVQSAAEDWFRLLMDGRTPSPEGQKLLRNDEISVGSAQEITESGFKPSAPWQALVVAEICLREDDLEQAGKFLVQAMENPDLQEGIVLRVRKLPDNSRDQLDLKSLLTRISPGRAAETVASILELLEGDEDWKIALATELKWDNPAEEAQFKFKYLLSRNRVVLAGSSYVEGSIGEQLIDSVAKACSLTVRDMYREALDLLVKPVKRPWASSMARTVLEFILPKSPAFGVEIRKLIAESYKTEKRFDDVSSILSPVFREEGVLELLESMIEDHPGEFALIDSLTRTAAAKGDFEKFHKYSAVMLDIDSGSAEELMNMAISMASDSSSGRAYLYAARLAIRYRIEADIDELVSSAVLLAPELSHEGIIEEFHQRVGKVPEALCGAASAKAPVFCRICRENPGIEVKLNEEIIDIASGQWVPEENSEALLYLSEQALKGGFQKRAEDILFSVAGRGEPPWKADASRKLLAEVIAGKADRIRFWRTVEDDEVISEALEKYYYDGFDKISGEEAREMAPAVLKSGQGIRRLFQLADEGTFFPLEDITLRRELAEACMKSLDEMPEEDRLSIPETGKLLGILLSAGMLSEAASIARKNGSNEILSSLRDGLSSTREALSADSVENAFNLVVSGRSSEVLEALEKNKEESPVTMDIKALALWNLGYREQAISVWVQEFRQTRREVPLKRLYWALEQSGALMERTALRRYIAGNYPGLTQILSQRVSEYKPNQIELIRGLRYTSKEGE